MPTYEYRCSFCHEVSDAFQRMSDTALIKCPHCGKDGLERIVSGGAGVIYKGEGWYVTDYSKKSSGGKEESSKHVEKSSDTKSPQSSSESTDTKPQAELKKTVDDRSSTEKPAPTPSKDTNATKSE